MKVLVFPALLAVAIITGTPKSGTTPAASVAPAKPVPTVSMANLAPEKTQLPASDALLKVPLGAR